MCALMFMQPRLSPGHDNMPTVACIDSTISSDSEATESLSDEEPSKSTPVSASKTLVVLKV